MIRISHLSLMRGTKVLFDEADAVINPGEKVGLVGPNGAGKSSLFALLQGEIHPDKGDVDFPASWRIAHVAQETPALNRSALEYTIDGDIHLRKLQAELAELEAKPQDAASGIKIAELHTALADANAYTVQSRAEQLLTGLGFSREEMAQPVASFSGGWRMRLNLAQALICPSELLLLDEPTNHLDLDAILWLEDWLKRYPGTLIIISHDRDFLDGAANVIINIDGTKLRRYTGNYSSFERQRAEQVTLMAAMVEKQARRRAHLEAYINRFRYKATKARQAQSRLKMLEKMEELAPLRATAEFSFDFLEPESSPNPLLVMENITAGYTDTNEWGDILATHPIVSTKRFALQTGERIGILGVNGAGKSTFIRTIAGELKPLSGVFTTGKGLKIGYFAQHQVETLRDNESPLWHLAKLAPDTREQDLRNFLGSFNFHGDMATDPVAPLSGGEKARLALALIVWQRPNLLLLDEPTNHLDLAMREALTEALAQYEGTLLLVSHDRHLLRATTDRFYIVEDHKLREFDGDLEDYRNWLFDTRLKQTVLETPAATDKTTRPGIDRKEQKRLEAQQRQRLSTLKKPLEARIAKLDKEMEQLNGTLALIDRQMNDPTLYDFANKEKLKSMLAQQAECKKRLAAAEEEWMEKQEALEEILAQANQPS
jgi:ATP-binding cassette subfamily F protein 3